MPKKRACATAPGLPQTTRRRFLQSLPLVAVPALAQAQAPDPMVPLYREWIDARRTWRDLLDLPGNEDWDDPRSIAAEKREWRASGQMIETTPTSLEGIGAMAALAWEYVEPGTTDPEEYAFQAQSMECLAIMAIWRACTGREGYPVTRRGD